MAEKPREKYTSEIKAVSEHMNRLFVEAFDMREHPIKKTGKRIQTDYITALTYIVEKTISDSNCYQDETKKYIVERLYLYQKELFSEISIPAITEKAGCRCLMTFRRPWRRKYRCMLVCDMALILFEEPLLLRAAAVIKEKLSAKCQADIDQIFLLLQNKQAIHKKYLSASLLIDQYRANKDFFAKDERKIIVTANMSAGKSTLINALVGKPIARTSQEVCTGNVCYLFNKPYEDGNIHLSTQSLTLKATTDDLQGYDWTEHISIASYFAGIVPDIPRLCITDTPGVDAALYIQHSKLAYDALLNDSYDAIIYVISPTRLGTDAEKKHLQWVVQHLPKDKIIFVLNKLDDYRDFSDSVGESIQNFKAELLELGFKNPVICPISAYFSYLLKLKMTGQVLSEDEEDEYVLYSRKFKRPSYDLSRYYENVQCLPADSEEVKLSKCAGLY